MSTITQLSCRELEELFGFDPPAHELAIGNGERVVLVVHDQYGAYDLDNPRDDNSGEDSWEWIEWGSGRERERWLEDNFCCAECGSQWGNEDEACPSGYEESDKHRYPDAFRPGLDFWIEKYDHSLVRYAPTNESSQIDRQWDVAPGVAIVRFKEDHGCGHVGPGGLLEFVRAVCDAYTDWCNGAVYGIVTFERTRPTDPSGFLAPEDFEWSWEQTDSCWGYNGSEAAESAAEAELA